MPCSSIDKSSFDQHLCPAVDCFDLLTSLDFLGVEEEGESPESKALSGLEKQSSKPVITKSLPLPRNLLSRIIISSRPLPQHLLPYQPRCPCRLLRPRLSACV